MLLAVEIVSSDYTSDAAEMLKAYRKLAWQRGTRRRCSCKVPLELAGMAASSTLQLSETIVTSAVVFDNAARAQLTGRRHNATYASDAQKRHNFK